jgi:hypothetical protein
VVIASKLLRECFNPDTAQPEVVDLHGYFQIAKRVLS